jgi:catechol 2,3-dioxygenase-like lactoylglutathione lyase family enzyme
MNAKHRLGQADVATNLAVRDIARARSFYGDVLGLEEAGREGEQLLTYRSGSSLLFVYQSEFAGSNQATAASWLVGERVDEIAMALKAKGVIFEHYDMPDLRLEGDVHVGHGMRVAWFKDPDGNILSLVSG